MAAHHPFARGAARHPVFFGFCVRAAYRTPHARTESHRGITTGCKGTSKYRRYQSAAQNLAGRWRLGWRLMQPGQTWRCLLLQFVSGASADRIRGVARYFRVAFPKGRIIPACDVAADAPGACVYVSPSGEIVHGRDYGTAGDAAKQMLLDNFLRGVTARLRYNATRWISLAVAYGASGATAPLGRGPTVAFAAKDPRHSEALLVPNPFFISPDWWDARTEAWLAAARKRPWATRDRRVLFRGSCGPGAAARFDLMAMPDPGGTAPRSHLLSPHGAWSAPRRSPRHWFYLRRRLSFDRQVRSRVGRRHECTTRDRRICSRARCAGRAHCELLAVPLPFALAGRRDGQLFAKPAISLESRPASHLKRPNLLVCMIYS